MSIAADVRYYLAAHPVVEEALAAGIVNQRALARRIAADEGLRGDEAAIQAALRRYRPADRASDQRLRRLLARAQLDVRTRMAVLTLAQSWSVGRRLEEALRTIRNSGGTAHVVHGSEAVTVITDQDHVDALTLALDPQELRAVREGLAQVNVRTPSDVEDVPGVLVRVAGALSARDINFVEVLSCHKDNIFLVAEPDLAATLDALRPVLA